ncbi:MAG: glycoside hydrolase family 125 protein [Clostridia bacterium]|nr:glycoside hydrolase family 125 protein [Clostridia bacterium]
MKPIPASMRAYMERILAKTDNEDLKKLFNNAFVNTWATTIQETEDDAFVITGDIPAMWLRDSSAQVKNYLAIMPGDPEIQGTIRKVIARQMHSILMDPYANAFNFEANGQGHTNDLTEMSPWVWERKYEVDSLCYPVHLCYEYWKISGAEDIFTQECHDAFALIIKTWKTEQHHESSPYLFSRLKYRRDCDTLHNRGKGNPVSYTGMTWSGFRPSDDACTYGYLVPSNMFAVVILREMAEMARHAWQDEALSADAMLLAAVIDGGIRDHAIINTKDFGLVYAYEVDGRGNFVLMDDANVPSLLSAPYLGYCKKDDPIYQNTRRLLLSKTNPFYFEGKKAKGIGSPHTPKDHVWHIALAMQGLTSQDREEKKMLLDMIMSTHADLWYMHEGFHVDDPGDFSRPWFAWANTLCSEFFIDCINEGII